MSNQEFSTHPHPLGLFFSPLTTNSCKKQLLVSYCLLLLLWLLLAVYFCSPTSHLPLCSKKKKKSCLCWEFTVCMGHELIPGTCPPLHPCLFNIFRNNTCDWKSQNLPNHVPLLWWLGICNEIMFQNKHIISCTSIDSFSFKVAIYSSPRLFKDASFIIWHAFFHNKTSKLLIFLVNCFNKNNHQCVTWVHNQISVKYTPLEIEHGLKLEWKHRIPIDRQWPLLCFLPHFLINTEEKNNQKNSMPPGDQCLQEVLMCSRQKNTFNTAGELGLLV